VCGSARGSAALRVMPTFSFAMASDDVAIKVASDLKHVGNGLSGVDIVTGPPDQPAARLRMIKS
jgi:hypothetical protein